jgi:predicted MFS family arabinose efflux permease
MYLFCLVALTPLYPDVARDLGLSAEAFGILVGASTFVSAILQLPTGAAVDQVGSRLFMAVGLLLVSLSQVLRWMATDPMIFAASQVALGMSLPFFMSANLAAVANAYFGAGRAEAIGYVISGANFGQIAGLVMVGILGEFFAWRSISLGLAFVPLAMLPFVVKMPEAPRTTPAASLGRRLADALGFLVQARPASLAVVAALTLGAGAASSYLLPFVLRRQGIGSGLTGLLLLPFVIGALIGPPTVGRIADRLGAGLPLRMALMIGTISATAFAVIGPSPLAIAICFFAMGVSVGGVTSLVPSQIVDLADKRGTIGAGSALGGVRLAQHVGAALGPPLTGAIFIHVGVTFALLGVAGALLVGLLVSMAAIPWGRGSPGVRPST